MVVNGRREATHRRTQVMGLRVKKNGVGLFQRGTTLIATSKGPQGMATPSAEKFENKKTSLCRGNE